MNAAQGGWFRATGDGWMARDPDFLDAAFGIAAPQAVTGFVHLGTPKAQPADRPRPDIDAITSWVDR